MKYLKKFATVEEYNAFLEGGQLRRPNVSLVEEPFTTYYHNHIPLGIFIQHVNGTLYTTSEWADYTFSNDEANGVALINDNVRFVIAKTAISSVNWSSSQYTLVEGILTTDNVDAAKEDFAGYANTQLMLAKDTSGAGFSCANYTFPNGDKGYLPALGELFEILLNITAINSAMSLIGGQAINTGGSFWTSTQSASNAAWDAYSLYGNVDAGKTEKRQSRPCRVLTVLK